ncbi:hypothetical protein CI1B_66140 [Bradyrhizobium ivorense]|uniref:Oligosaccharide repeat unit polymerase n=1 Tax=Bradyrhizobium ivorense TaxID=2511166 RepID=A0A508TQY3_9BRAD|nr:hypothetical protein [Bradyrhizobium ivorense]VIO76721.1 hypothetical protein CI1B_66140 [Bradyrhizobium ivorense]
MQRFVQLAGGLSSPAILIVLIWCVALALVAVGPIDFPGQPSPAVLAIVGTCLAAFLLAYRGGSVLFEAGFARRHEMPAPSVSMLNRTVTATSLTGIAGIGLMAFDRIVLSGVNNSSYSELLRCAPGLISFIEIKRTPILYLGYVTFSFGFVSVILFLLKGEVIRGWAAALAQLSIVSPVGYAVLYSGRFPILLAMLLIIATMLIRVSQGRRPLPAGHHLLLKVLIALGLFALYSSWVWSSRQNFCIQLTPLIRELEEKQRQASGVPSPGQQTPAAPVQQAPSPPLPPPAAQGPVAPPPPGEGISGTDLSKKMAEAAAVAPKATSETNTADAVLAIMLEAWNVKPRGYVTTALNAGYLSPRAALIGLSTFFYLTHGVRTIDIAWQARDKFSPQWGVYEVGILSPILRVFFPQVQQVSVMEAELKATGIYGFFPTAWLAAFIDFGMIGAIVYILIWGGIAGWSATGARRSDLLTPQLLLIFVITSILLSPVQGPLGVANAALILVSMLVVGLVVDGSPRFAKRTDPVAA